MKSYNFKTRKDWYNVSAFYKFTKKHIEKQEDYPGMFTEATLAIDSPSGYMIDLGWNGEFKKRELVGRIVRDNDWTKPIEERSLKTFHEAVKWVNRWIKKIEHIAMNPDRKIPFAP